MADITFDEQHNVLQALMTARDVINTAPLPDEIVIERITKAITLLENIFKDEG